MLQTSRVVATNEPTIVPTVHDIATDELAMLPGCVAIVPTVHDIATDELVMLPGCVRCYRLHATMLRMMHVLLRKSIYDCVMPRRSSGGGCYRGSSVFLQALAMVLLHRCNASSSGVL